MTFFEDFNLTDYNSYRIQAFCKRAYFPTCETDFIDIYKQHEQDDIIVIGGGWNIILSKPYYEKVFIIVGHRFSTIKRKNDKEIECEAGADTKSFSEFALAHSLTGAEIFYDIPSSIGGAVVMNAGASGEEIKDILSSVRYLDIDDMRIKNVINQDIGFEYRNSIFQRNNGKIVLSASFRLASGTPDEIRRKMESVKVARWNKQPRNFPNAGSVFKRPPGYYVGAMIEELDLKGYTIGGAQISKKHGGFIINLGNATGADILAIIQEVSTQVKERFKIDLEIEQRII